MILAQTKTVLEALAQENHFNTQNGDYGTHCIARIYRMRHFCAAYFSYQQEPYYMSPIDRPLFIISASLKYPGGRSCRGFALNTEKY